MKDKNIVVWGAGANAEKIGILFENHIICFVDRDAEKWGKTILGKPIISPENYFDNYASSDVVISCVGYESEIRKQFEDRKLSNYHIAHDFYVEIINYVNNVVFNSAALIFDYPSNEKKFMEDMKFYSDLLIEKNFYIFDKFNYHEIEQMNYDVVFVYAPVTHSEILYNMRNYSNKKNMYDKRGYEIDGFIVVPSENDWNKIKDESDWILNIKNSGIVEATDSFVEAIDVKDTPMFELVEIETINRCNGTCSFCPVNAHEVQREKKYMDDWLFEKIISDLESIKYSGRISLFSNNEPFLDKNIIARQKYAREHLPYAKFHLFTNGTIMNLIQFKNIIEYVDHLIIDNYTSERQLLPKVKDIVDYCESEQGTKYKDKVTIYVRKNDEILSTRGGEANNRCITSPFIENKCALPFQQIVIRPDGNVSLCCNDPLGRYTLGNVGSKTVMEVWKSKEYEEIRRGIKSGRKNIAHCENCDHFQLY